MLPPPVCATAPSLIVMAPSLPLPVDSTSIVPALVTMSPLAACVMAPAARTVTWPLPASTPAFSASAPDTVCSLTWPAPAAETPLAAVVVPPFTVSAPAETVSTKAPPLVVARSSCVADTSVSPASRPVVPTRCTATVTRPTVRPSVSVRNRPPAPALALSVVALVSSASVPLPMPLPAVSSTPPAVRFSVAAASASVIEPLPATTAMFAVPALMASSATLVPAA